MKKRVDRLMAKPWVAHILRMQARYTNRLGNQFAGAITYFSVLALVPIIMFAFGVTGMVLTVLRPDLMAMVLQSAGDALAGFGGSLQETILGQIEEALTNWGVTGGIGLATALYAGAGWVANIKSAVRAQWRPEFDTNESKRFIVWETLANMGLLVGLLIIVAITVGVSQVATSLKDVVLGLLNLDGEAWARWAFSVGPMVVSLAAGWLLFLYIFRFFPERENRPSRSSLAWGGLIGAVGLMALQYLSGIIMGAFSGNAAAAVFGPIIVLMLFFNLFARLILYVCAWVATRNQPAVAREYNKADEPLRAVRHDVEVMAAPGHWSAAREDRRRKEQASGDSTDDSGIREDSARQAWNRQRSVRGPQPRGGDPRTMPHLEPDARQSVPQDVAARGVRIGMGAGWVAGTAAGVGLGAIIAGLVGKLFRR